jgi:predicted phosphodiesterase
MGCVRLVCLSDTHMRHAALEVPDGDILVHAGDATTMGTPEELARFADWMGALPHEHKLLVAGNHDFLFETDRAQATAIMGDVQYLQDQAISILGLRLWGAPWLPVFRDWAFNLPRGKALAEKWDMIPSDTDFLITHGPAWGRLDLTTRGEHVGCEELVHAVDRVKPKVHMFGHIHEASGTRMQGETLLVNAASCNRWFELTNKPIVIDWEPGGEPQVVSP